MSKLKTAFHLINHNRNLFFATLIQKVGFFLPDRLFLILVYRLRLGHSLDLNNPKYFTEKLQWLKLYDRNPLYTQIVDKYEVKKIVSRIIGDGYIIPTLGVWDKIADIPWEFLPNKFVLKTTFGGGSDGVFICKDKTRLDISQTINKLSTAMKTNPYKRLREWPYKNVPKRIIAEKYIEDKDKDLWDYKFYCFNGEPKVLLIASNRYTTHNFDYFDMEFNKLPITSAMGVNNNLLVGKPDCFEEMKKIAKTLSVGYPHIRIDLYCSNGNIFFGEMTLYDSSGFDNMNSDEWDLIFGGWLELPNNRIETIN